MYDLTIEAQFALQGARRKVAAALLANTRDGGSADEARHLTCLNYLLMSAEFVAAEAVNAAQVARYVRAAALPPERGASREK